MTIQTRLLAPLTLLLGGCVGNTADVGSLESAVKPLTAEFADATGRVSTYSLNGKVDPNNAFFASLGTNGRSCGTCHTASDGWAVAAPHIQQIFDQTQGTDPLFRLVDGANAPTADVSTLTARQSAYSMLRTKGLFRIGMAVPANAEFDVIAVDDPYHYATSTSLSFYRRPPPATNVKFLTTIMWDGREMPFGTTIDAVLLHQSVDATMGHAEAAQPPTAAQQREIVDFESIIFTAQSYDNNANNLDADQALGGAANLSDENFYVGINDVLGADPQGKAFNPVSMTLFEPWRTAKGNGNGVKAARASVLHGQDLFNTKKFNITGVAGLNDALGVASISGTCSSCHDSPDVGNHSVALPIDIGLADGSRRTADLPLYTVRNKLTYEVRTSTDLGRAMVTGKWADLNKMKGPVLRSVAAHPPFFHNGSAATLDDVVAFYDSRFGIGFTAQEKADLAAFLRAL
jgi:hypothetical protein